MILPRSSASENINFVKNALDEKCIFRGEIA
jgi:hypothetical protein